MKYIVYLIAILFVAGCGKVETSTSNATSADSSSSPNKTDDGFIEGVWVDKWLLETIKKGDLDAACKSLRNYTQFGTFRDDKGKPKWSATVPDTNGELEFKDGKWYFGSEPLIEFQIKNGDTLAQYLFKAGGYQEEGVGPIRTYQKVPRFREGDTYIPDDWLYQLYYFPGSYELTNSSSKISSEIGLTREGKVVGMKEYSEYSLNIGNSLPVFAMKSSEGWIEYVIEGTKSGFTLYAVMNEDLDGLDLDIIQGPQVFKFSRKH